MLNPKNRLIGSLLLLALLIGIPVWQSYLHGGFLFYFTILLAPYILYVQQKEVASTRYVWASIFCGIGHLVLGINILYLSAFLFFVLFLIEWQYGKLNALSIYWIFLLSPLTIFLFGVFSFPIRLELSSLASWLLSFVQSDLTCQGNIIVLNGAEFSVDEACMGLKMVSYSYLVFLVLIAFFEKKRQVELSKPLVVLVLSIGTVLILFANLIRIITIILLQAMPDTAAHEIIGVISWLAYVISPIFFLIRFIVHKWGRIYPIQAPKKLSSFLVTTLCISSLSLLAIGSYKTLTKDKTPLKAIVPIQINGFEQQIAEDGVVQLKNENVLIYIKPACAPYRANHAPNICWKGSGYAFSKECLKTIDNLTVITAQLKKGDDILYTAWWYDNGNTQTANQLEWRWNALKGQGNYQLFNVTVEDPELLKKYIRLLMK
jgi:exosortase N